VHGWQSVWRQFNSVQSKLSGRGGWGLQTDGGTTWTFPGVLETNVFRSDPGVLKSERQEGKNLFISGLCRTFLPLTCTVARNFGQTWTVSKPDGGGTRGGGDKQWFTIDKTGGSRHGFQTNQFKRPVNY